jgi:AcrR family transcriptional regulator
MRLSKTDDRSRPGTYARGEETRRRMIEAAIDMFALHGYEGASTRLLAESAGVNLPAIQYYFGGKAGLYRAVIDHIVQKIAGRMAAAAAAVEVVLARDDAPRPALLAALYGMLDAFLVLMVDDPERQRLFIHRAEIEHASALEPLQDAIRHSVVKPCIGLIGRLIDRPAEDEVTVARTVLILGQVTVFGHKGARRDVGWDDGNEERLNALRKLIHEHTAAILRAARQARR